MHTELIAFILGVVIATTINLLTWIPDWYNNNQYKESIKIELYYE